MNKIEMIEEQDTSSIPLDIASSSKMYWKDYLELYGYNREKDESLQEMCDKCIASQIKKHGKTRISCYGINNLKNKYTHKYGEDVYNTIIKDFTPEQLDYAQQLEDPLKWVAETIKDENPHKKMFDPRWYQVKILSCSAKRKVLRMGRRCIDGEEKIKGLKKNYSIKHLYHLALKQKKLPKILTFNQETLELEYTDKYYLVPNIDRELLKVTYENNTNNIITKEHPLMTFKEKQYQFIDAQYLKVGDLIIKEDNTSLKIKNITLVKNRKSYHISVLHTNTFISSNGVIHHNTGKALDINTPIPTPDGWTLMRDIKEGDQVFDDKGEICNVTFATEIQYNRECYELEFDNGSKIIADADHQWNVSTRERRRNYETVEESEITLTTDKLLDFKTKHYAIRLTEPVKYHEKELPLDPYLLGFWLGDGRTSDGRLTIGDQDAEEIIKILELRNHKIKKLKSDLTYSVEGLTKILTLLGVKDNKHIPLIYLQASEAQRLELLRGLMDSDGAFLSRDSAMEFTTTLEILGDNFLELTRSLGIKTKKHINKSFLDGKQCKDRVRFSFNTHLKVFNLKRKDKNVKEKSWNRSNFIYIKSIKKVESRPVKCISVDSPNNLYLAGKDYIVTHNTASMTVGLLHRLLTIQDYRVLMVAPMATMIDEVFETIKKYCSKMEGDVLVSHTTNPIHEIEFSTGSVFKGVTAGAQGAKGTRGKGADLLYIDECLTAFARILMSDGTTKAIVDVEEGEYVTSYNLSTNKFNSQRVLAVKCTGIKKVYKYKTITGKIFTATDNHPVLTSEGWKPIEKAKDIGVHNKKGIFFETIIEKKYKGKEKVYNLTIDKNHTYIADNFVVHNCDFLATKDLNSILAILADTPDTEFWASSTPMGEHNLFRLAKDPKYKEFHYPTYVSPAYTDDLDEDFKSQMDTSGIIQEILACFGADDNMVFQIPFIEKATLPANQTINVPDILNNRRDYNIIIGADWNHDKVGTRIVVVAQSKLTKKFMIVDKARVASLGWTQPLAMQKIIDYNRKWNADFLYVDEGFGTTQASMLRQYGLQQAAKRLPPNHPDLKLIDTQSVTFNATLLIPDPITGQDIRKQTKQYIVENTADYLSRDLLILQEEIDNDIIAQLKNYYIKSRSASGLKVFSYRDKNIGDHDLDALMLALFGFKQNYEDANITNILALPIINSKEEIGYNSELYGHRDTNTYDVFVSKFNSKKKSRASFKGRSKW